ncbi:hypothetical protein Sjap_008785 [Stephania japonica]|uniref:NAC domain-containing protein n=1 Tax=Stephania japonica TaxID=461633 RepID=A0AAP0PET3_9MAGN
MENYNLPWGFTFNPTDEEIMGYLQAKASNIQLPFVDPVVEFDVFTTHPTQLHTQQRLNATGTHLYFYVTKSGKNRSAGNGFWLASTGATAILNRKREVIGYRSMLVYYNNALNTNTKKRDKSAKTKWIMHEYTLPEAHNMSSKGHKEPFWTICKIGETGRTFGGDNYQSSSVPSQQQQQPQQQQLNMELMGPHHQQEVDQQQQLQQSECDDGRSLVLTEDDLPLEFWVDVNDHDNSSSEVVQEAAPRRIGSLIFPDQLNDDEAVDDDQEWIENLESILEVDDEAQQPLQQLPIQQQFEQQPVLQQSESVAYICLDDLQPQQQSELIVLPDDEDDACIEDMENWIGNFDYCMDMIKELHDEVYDVDGDSELEIDEQPFPKCVKY